MWPLGGIAVVAVAAVVSLLVVSGSGSKTTATASTTTSTTFTPNPLLESELSGQRAGVDVGISTYEISANDSTDVAVFNARSLDKAINTYVAFLAAQSWPSNLQADVNADRNAWNQTASPVADLAGQSASALPAGKINADLRSYHAALLTAYASDAILQRDAPSLLCGSNATADVCGP